MTPADVHGPDDLRRQLAHLSRLGAMGQMAPALAHELRQPLTAIVSYLTAARRLLESGGAADREALAKALEDALAQARRADRIVRHLRSFAGDRAVEPTRVGVAELVGEVGELILITARQAGVVVETAPLAPAHVLVDRVQMQQVLFNLMRNAVEAMAGGPRRALRVSAHELAGQVQLSVSDTGPGLAPWVAARLFEPFVTTKPDGMGLGLSICRTIVEQHGGRLWFEAVAEGGAAFHLTLPLAEESAPD